MFLGYPVARQQNISEATVQKIDAEIRRLVEAGYSEAQRILTEKRADLETPRQGPARIRDARRGDEIKDLLAGKRPDARIHHRADDAARFRGSHRRQRASAPGDGTMEPQPQA